MKKVYFLLVCSLFVSLTFSTSSIAQQRVYATNYGHTISTSPKSISLSGSPSPSRAVSIEVYNFNTSNLDTIYVTVNRDKTNPVPIPGSSSGYAAYLYPFRIYGDSLFYWGTGSNIKFMIIVTQSTQ